MASWGQRLSPGAGEAGLHLLSLYTQRLTDRKGGKGEGRRGGEGRGREEGGRRREVGGREASCWGRVKLEAFG